MTDRRSNGEKRKESKEVERTQRREIKKRSNRKRKIWVRGGGKSVWRECT